MAKLWKDKTLRERVEVKLIALVNVETKNNSWGKHFWSTSSTSKVLARALENLKNLTYPKSKVIRNGAIVEINSQDIVVGDYLMVEEGTTISADGTIVHSNDFSVNESVLTGELILAASELV